MSKDTLRTCWIQHGGEHEWAAQTGQALEKHNVDVHFVCTMQEAYDFYNKHSLSASFFPADIFYGDDLEESKLREIEKKYGPPHLSAIASSDVHLQLLFPNNPNAQAQVIARSIVFWEQFLQENNIQYVLMRDAGSVATRPAYLVARHLGIPHVILHMGPSSEHMSMCNVEDNFMWSELKDAMQLPMQDLSDEEKKIALEVAAKKSTLKEGKQTITRLFHIWDWRQRSIRSLKRQKRHKQDGQILDAAREMLMRQLYRKRLWWRFVTWKLFPYKQIQEGEQYICMPLFNETAWVHLATRKFISSNLIEAIRHIALHLPAGHKLYLKEHPSMPGEFSLRRLTALANIPNVKIIDPEVQGKELIVKSQATIVMTGSSGWEAYLLKKPVILLGLPWLALSPLTYTVENFEQFGSTIFKAINKGDSIYDDEKSWLWFIHQAIQTSAPASIYKYTPPFFSDHNSENSEKIAKTISTILRERLAKNS